MSMGWIPKTAIPSFMTSKSLRRPTVPQDSSSAKIRALDGLRGIACLIVFVEHYTWNFSPSFWFGYGVDDYKSLVQWPFIRIFWSGWSAVTIFFVISGYVLSYKPLQMIRRGNMAGLQRSLSSSIFRRPFRLYLPTYASIVFWGVLSYLGLFRMATALFQTDDNYLHLNGEPPPRFNSLLSQVSSVFGDLFQLLDVWDWYNNKVKADQYNPHTWTIPVETRCSMMLFLTLMATALMSQAARAFSVSTLVVFCVCGDQIEPSLYLTGMLLAELDIQRHGHKEPLLYPPTPSSSSDHRPKSSEATWLLMFVGGLYLASAPVIGCDITPGFATLYKLAPSTISDGTWFLRSVGAVGIAWSVVNSKTLQPYLTNRFALYLGDISFAFYLMHGNIIKSVGYMIFPYTHAVAGVGDPTSSSATSLVLSWLFGLILVLPVTFWISDVFWRAVDMPCLRFIKVLEARMLKSTDR